MDIDRVFVAGTGHMGSGIAQLMAVNGKEVFMYDATAALAENARLKIIASLSKLASGGKISAADRDACAGRLSVTADLNDAARCGMAIEAVTENPDIKAPLLRALGEALPERALLASNTSSISITTLASHVKHPERFAGMHFFNPVHAMKLVEIVRGLLTSDGTAAALKTLAGSLGKVAIVCKDSPGFIVNRLVDPMLNEAAYLVGEGVAAPADIDLAVVNGLNHRMGPLALIDLIGVDVVYDVMKVLYQSFGDTKYRPCPLLKQMIDANLLGRKSGRGFYEYNAEGGV